MSRKAKIKKANRHAIGLKTRVLIVMPIPLSRQITDEVATFCAKVVSRGIADWKCMPARAAEDARNRIIRDVLAENPVVHTHIFFLDADTLPYDDYVIEKLLMHKKPVVAGITPTQRTLTPWRYYWNVVILKDGKEHAIRRHPWDKSLDEMPSSLFKCHLVGGTTILLHRDVFKMLSEPYQMTVRKGNGDVAMGEDYFFCQKLRNAGHEIWIDPTLKCGHYQTIDLGGY